MVMSELRTVIKGVKDVLGCKSTRETINIGKLCKQRYTDSEKR